MHTRSRMQSNAARHQTANENDTRGEPFDPEQVLVEVLLERVGSLPADRRIELATAIYRALMSAP